jgi:uncharacterized protein (DUF934 family)
VWLGPDDDVAPLLPWLATLPLIAIRFPVFTDGRGYSLARLLRGRHGYAGELRAVGDVLRDQLYFLQRCGFDSFALRADQPPEEPWRPSTTTAGRRSPPADRPRGGGGGGHTPHGRFLL